MTCPSCASKATDPALIAACEAVDDNTDTVLAKYLESYHLRGHQL